MSRNHFEFDELPLEAFKSVGGKMSLFGGGGAPSETTSNVTQTNLPAYAEPFVTDIMQRGQAQSYRPYTPYGNQRIAGFTPAQQQAQQTAAQAPAVTPSLQQIAQQCLRQWKLLGSRQPMMQAMTF